MTDHDVDAQDIGGFHHIDTARPQRGAGALPEIAAIEHQRVLASAHLFTQLVAQRFHVRHAAHSAEFSRSFVEIEIGVGMGLRGVRLHAHFLKECLADHMGWAAEGVAHAKIHVGLAEKYGIELTVKVRAMQNTHIAALGDGVEILGDGNGRSFFAATVQPGNRTCSSPGTQ